jgi:hypothetical protein
MPVGDVVAPAAEGEPLSYDPAGDPDPGIGSTLGATNVLKEYGGPGSYAGSAVVQMRENITTPGVWKYGPVRQRIVWWAEIAGEGDAERAKNVFFRVYEVTFPPEWSGGVPRVATDLRTGPHSFIGTKDKLPFPPKANKLPRSLTNPALPAQPPENWNTKEDNDGRASRLE